MFFAAVLALLVLAASRSNNPFDVVLVAVAASAAATTAHAPSSNATDTASTSTFAATGRHLQPQKRQAQKNNGQKKKTQKKAETPPIPQQSKPSNEPSSEPSSMPSSEPEQGTKIRPPNFRPHVLFVVMDDLGAGDLGARGSGIMTPYLDQLSRAGVRLRNYYTHPVCSPSRIAMLTGRYPYRSGIFAAIRSKTTKGMATDDETLPQLLQQQAGYRTHGVGKWHVGLAKWSQLPTARGFHSYFGTVANADHYSHAANDKHDGIDDNSKVYTMFKATAAAPYSLSSSATAAGACSGNDYKKKNNKSGNKNEVDTGSGGGGCGSVTADSSHNSNFEMVDRRGEYSTHVFAAEATKLVRKYKNNQPTKLAQMQHPLFLYLAFSAVHTPLQAPAKYVNLYKHKSNWGYQRKVYAGMLTAADEAVGNVTAALKQAGMYEDTLIVFTTDNGAVISTCVDAPPGSGQKRTICGPVVRARTACRNQFIHEVRTERIVTTRYESVACG